MKLLPPLLLVFALLFVGCGKPDLDDPDTLNKILEEALDVDDLQARGKEGEELIYAPNSQTPYTGWAKEMYENGQVHELYHYKEGKWHGLGVGWYENGQKKWEDNYKDGKQHGLETKWYENGQKKWESQYENGWEVADSVKKWSSNGERTEALDDAINNLKQMWYLLFEYDQEEGEYPYDLDVLQKEAYIESEVLDELNSCLIDDKKTKFTYRPGFSTASSSAVILLHTPKPIAGKMAYLLNDGSVRTVAAEQFEKLINAQK